MEIELKPRAFFFFSLLPKTRVCRVRYMMSIDEASGGNSPECSSLECPNISHFISHIDGTRGLTYCLQVHANLKYQ